MSTETSVRTGHQGVPSRLSGNLGPLSIVFMVVAAAAPLTIFVSTPVNMLNSNGAGIAFDYMVAPLILLIFGAGFAAMSVHVPKAGAFYSYIAAALGRPAGVGAGMMAMLGYVVFQNFVFMLFGFTVEGMLSSLLGTGLLPWWGWSLAGLVLVAVLGYMNIDLSAKVLSVALVLEVLVIVVLDVVILARGGGPEGIQIAPFFSPEILTGGSLALGILFGISVGLGFEATALFRDEARDPARTIPRAVFITLIGAAVFYGLAVLAWMQAFGVNGVMDAVAADPDSIVYVTAEQWVGPLFMQLVTVLATVSMFASVLAYHNIVTRYLHSLGHSVLPEQLTWVHRRQKSPYVASVTTSAAALVLLVAILLSGADPFMVFGWEIAVGTICPLILFVLTSVAIFRFFRRNPKLPVSRWVSVVSPVVSFVLLGALSVFALLNFSTLSAASPVVNLVLQLLPVAVFVGGVGVALLARRFRPGGYDSLREHGQAAEGPSDNAPLGS